MQLNRPLHIRAYKPGRGIGRGPITIDSDFAEATVIVALAFYGNAVIDAAIGTGGSTSDYAVTCREEAEEAEARA
jgi:hypothetical protein